MLTTFLTALVTTLHVAAVDTVNVAQGVEYRIEAHLDEETDILTGRAELRYANNAATALDTLWFHQHLNAFRPNSAWARRELEYGERRFQDLGPDEHAFERLTGVSVDGSVVRPVYPGAPDSTVVAIPLPAPLMPGETAVVRLDWQARLSTLPRRQGRRDRHYDFAQWYPRIAAYTDEGWQVQPLLPQGEFFGEFGSYDVTLDLAADQVVGATGVIVEGDPGWEGRARPGHDEILYHRDFYPARPPTPLGLLSDTPPEGRKQLRWRAEDVHHFAWSADPEFLYEGGRVTRSDSGAEPIAIHILYWPTDGDWADGVALERTVTALEWLQEMFGPYPWPQLTNLHRIEPGGTEFPMMMMNGSPSEGLIVHEGTHQYLHGILANNEFREGWLDEGFTSFLTNWYFEEQGDTAAWAGSMDGIRQLEQRGLTQPIGLAGAEFANPTLYSAMTYTKTDLVLRMLRWLIGEDQMRVVLRTLFDRHALSHIDEEDFRKVVADVTNEDLDWFFDQWIHTTNQLDYEITSAITESIDDRWITKVEIRRNGDAWMPVTLQVDGTSLLVDGSDPQQLIEVTTDARPSEVVLDPENILIDIDISNNRAPVTDH